MIRYGRGLLDLHDCGPRPHPEVRERVGQPFPTGEATRRSMIFSGIRVRMGEVNRTEEECDQKKDEPGTRAPPGAVV